MPFVGFMCSLVNMVYNKYDLKNFQTFFKKRLPSAVCTMLASNNAAKKGWAKENCIICCSTNNENNNENNNG